MSSTSKAAQHELEMMEEFNRNDISKFAQQQLACLDKELQAEVLESSLLTANHAPTVLQRVGAAVLNLHVASQRTGFGGKTLLELALDPAIGSGDLSDHGFRVGDICAVEEQPKGSERKAQRVAMDKLGVKAVVTKVKRESITVALDKEDAEVPGGKLWLFKLVNDATHKRLTQTMTGLKEMKAAEYSVLTQILFGLSSLSPITESELKADIVWHDQYLNDTQKESIRFCLASREVALVHGPPGTGKTHTLVELILQLLDRKQRLLVCGPSNISVDNIVERLASSKVPMVRLGHPARLLPSVLNHSLDVLTKTSDAAAIVSDIRSEMDVKQASLRKTRNGSERRVIYGELKDLRKEYRQREARVVGDSLRTSRVVLSTLHGAGGFHLTDQAFDVVIIDEASQALEAQCWIPILSSGAAKLVLAGDHLQLPPTIKSLNRKDQKSVTKNAVADSLADGVGKIALDKDASAAGNAKKAKGSKMSLGTTMFDRLLAMYGEKVKRMLTTQYRMHEKIMQFPSSAMYAGRLVAAEAVKHRLLRDLPYGVQDNDDTAESLIYFDTQGGDFPERADDDQENPKSRSTLLAESKANEHEAAVVRKHVRSLVDAGVKPDDIAVITPYNGQVNLLGQLLKDRFSGIEIGSIDGFQGREKECVIISLVRSNDRREVGFLEDKRRLNVAMTRPRRQLCVVGDSDTLASSKFLSSWMAFLQEHADLRYPDPGTVADLRDD